MAQQGHSGAEDNVHHVVPFSSYVKVFAALIFLTIVTVGVATPVTGVSFGALNAIVAFAIATLKAVLVLAIFMHLKYDNMMNRVIIGSGVFFLIVLYFFCIVDWGTRIPQGSTL